MKVRKKPVEVETVRWTGDNLDEVKEFAGEDVGIDEDFNNYLVIHTLEGSMSAEEGDYIVKGVEEEFYPVKSEVFNKIYEIIEED